MKNYGTFLTSLFLLTTMIFPADAQSPGETVRANMIVSTDLGSELISRHIYGHFSEHLGHCIYGGYWVGENALIPNTRGIRNDVVEALKKASAEVMAENADANPDFKRVMESYNGFLDMARPYGLAVKAPVFTQRA